jgi:hypothetical protein
MTRRPVVLGLALCAVALAACGGGSGDPGADATVRTFYRALLAGDGNKACGQLTPALARAVGASRGARLAGGNCPEVMHLAAGLNPGRARDDLHGLAVDVREHGDTATAGLRNPLTSKPETLHLTRTGGDWKIATLALRPRG